MSTIITGILSTIGSAIDTVADKIAPDQNIKMQTQADLEKFKLQLKAGLETEIMKQALSEKGFLLKDVQGARDSELELAKLEPPFVRYITGLLRGIFRPLVGFAILGAFIWSRFLCQFWGFLQVEFSERDYWIIGLVATFYYGGRTIEKIFNSSGK
jgi:hypothetical protein